MSGSDRKGRGEVPAARQGGSRLLDKAVQLLDLLAESGTLSMADIVSASGMSRPTVYRLCGALLEHGLVARQGPGRYRLGLHLLRWSHAAYQGSELVESAYPLMKELRDATGESVQLYVRRGEQRLCVASLESRHPLSHSIKVGMLLTVLAGSGGKVLRVWDVAGAPDLPDAAAIRQRGWTQSVAEREPGVASVSAPVVGARGELLAALTLSGPIERLGTSPGERFGRTVASVAAAISTRLCLDQEAFGVGGPSRA